MNIPKEYKNRIYEIMGKEADNYFNKLEDFHYIGIRTNLLKTNCFFLENKLNLKEKSNLCDYLYISNKNKISGNNPLHHAGAFYFQEPSASTVVEALDIQQGDRVLDMCAAPGGKTTQIAAKIGDGLVWSNEAVTSRIKPLVSNIERMGIKNAIVSNTSPNILAKNLKGFFNKVLVDAPCSGEGMIRKDKSILNNWSMENIIACSVRQLKILECAAECVKDGGFLCYSTCTFAPEENEKVIEKFLKNHKEFSLHKIKKSFGTNGLKKYAENTENIEYCRRIFLNHGGEGHFIALMKKSGEEEPLETYSEQEVINENIKLFKEFFKNTFFEDYKGIALSISNKVYIKPNIPTFNNLGIVRMGLFCGEVVKGRFVPSHALFSAIGLKSKNEINLSLQDEELKKYLHGEVIPCNKIFSGYVAVKVEGIPLGFGKAVNGILKNHYPKGLRTL